MDRFKHINDSLGHQAGDAVIKQVAERLKKVVKRESDVIARLGGDEFIVVLNEIENSTAVAHVAKNILLLASEPYQYKKHTLNSSGSMGIAMYPNDGKDALELIKNADIAMYDAKDKGRNKYKFFSEVLNVDVKEELELEADLHLAIEKNQLALHYQPQIDAHNLTMVGVEALLRWKHPTKGYISPFRFISIAEKSGQILEIGSWVINQACRDLSAWRKMGHKHLKVAINFCYAAALPIVYSRITILFGAV
jgi:diguanylate cyclase (GGDEF)-like protein